MDRQAKLAGSVENDPQETCAAPDFRSAKALSRLSQKVISPTASCSRLHLQSCRVGLAHPDGRMKVRLCAL
jgi:hypothetical protein